MPSSFSKCTYFEGLELEELAEYKCFQELVKETGILAKAGVNLVL